MHWLVGNTSEARADGTAAAWLTSARRLVLCGFCSYPRPHKSAHKSERDSGLLRHRAALERAGWFCAARSSGVPLRYDCPRLPPDSASGFCRVSLLRLACLGACIGSRSWAVRGYPVHRQTAAPRGAASFPRSGEYGPTWEPARDRCPELSAWSVSSASPTDAASAAPSRPRPGDHAAFPGSAPGSHNSNACGTSHTQWVISPARPISCGAGRAPAPGRNQFLPLSPSATVSDRDASRRLPHKSTSGSTTGTQRFQSVNAVVPGAEQYASATPGTAAPSTASTSESGLARNNSA